MGGAIAGETENANEPEGAPPTAQLSCHAPTSPAPTVPDVEKLPVRPVEPIAAAENGADGMKPETVTGEFGEAPVIDTVQVSPT
jgi:hypothetical protein